jgi:hypothetical protein
MKSTHWFILPLQDKSEQSEIFIQIDTDRFKMEKLNTTNYEDTDQERNLVTHSLQYTIRNQHISYNIQRTTNRS